jgi:hypothetical protein
MVTPVRQFGGTIAMRTLYLHVGVHRTATTSTQRFMRANFDVLLTKGYLYPFGVARHNAVVSRLRYGVQNVAEVAEDLLRRMDAKGVSVHSVVLSDEDMSQIADFNRFAALSRYFDVKVVVSLRRQDLWLESWYLQNVKWQWDPSLAHLTFDEFFARRSEFFWIDYAARLAHYEAVFGKGSVIAGVFEDADMPQGPIDAFLAMIGITDQVGFGPKLHHNSSLSPLTTEFMRHLPLDEMETQDRSRIEKACFAVDAGLTTNGSKLVMPHQQRMIVQSEYAEGNQAVAARYLARDSLFNAPWPGLADALATTALPRDADSLLRDFVAPFVRAMGAQLAEARASEVGAERRQFPKKDRVRPRT